MVSPLANQIPCLGSRDNRVSTYIRKLLSLDFAQKIPLLFPQFGDYCRLRSIVRSERLFQKGPTVTSCFEIYPPHGLLHNFWPAKPLQPPPAKLARRFQKAASLRPHKGRGLSPRDKRERIGRSSEHKGNRLEISLHASGTQPGQFGSWC
jgi:hypothetical protein